MSFKELTEQIVAQHHSFLRRELPQLSDLIGSLAADGANSEKLAEAEKLYNKVRNKIETHLRDEETVLFPTGVALEAGTAPPASSFDLRERLEEMEREHENCGNALLLLGDMLAALPESEKREKTLELLHAVKTDLDVHVEKENGQVHPRFLELLKVGSL